MVYPASLPLMRTPRLPVVDWTDAPADLNGLVRFAERRNLVSARVPSHFKRSVRPLYAFMTWTGTTFFFTQFFWSRINTGIQLCHGDWQVAIVFVSLRWGVFTSVVQTLFCSYHSVSCQKESLHTEGLIWQVYGRKGHWVFETCRTIILRIIHLLHTAYVEMEFTVNKIVFNFF